MLFKVPLPRICHIQIIVYCYILEVDKTRANCRITQNSHFRVGPFLKSDGSMLVPEAAVVFHWKGTSEYFISHSISIEEKKKGVILSTLLVRTAEAMC